LIEIVQGKNRKSTSYGLYLLLYLLFFPVNKKYKFVRILITFGIYSYLYNFRRSEEIDSLRKIK